MLMLMPVTFEIWLSSNCCCCCRMNALNLIFLRPFVLSSIFLRLLTLLYCAIVIRNSMATNILHHCNNNFITICCVLFFYFVIHYARDVYIWFDFTIINQLLHSSRINFFFILWFSLHTHTYTQPKKSTNCSFQFFSIESSTITTTTITKKILFAAIFFSFVQSYILFFFYFSLFHS